MNKYEEFINISKKSKIKTLNYYFYIIFIKNILKMKKKKNLYNT